MICPACASSEQRFWLARDGYDLFKCRSCGTGFIDPRQVPKCLAPYYGEGYFSGSDAKGYGRYELERENFLGNANDILRWIERYSPPGKLVEIGSAMGFFLETASRRGWTARGYELSSYASGLAKERYLQMVTCADFLSSEVALEPASVDLVIALDVVEHVAEPSVLLAKSHSALVPGGFLLVSTGALDSIWARVLGRHWRLIAPPEHLHYFTRTGLRDMATRAGFEIIARRHFAKRYSLASLSHFFGFPTPDFVKDCSVLVPIPDVAYFLARKPFHAP